MASGYNIYDGIYLQNKNTMYFQTRNRGESEMIKRIQRMIEKGKKKPYNITERKVIQKYG